MKLTRFIYKYQFLLLFFTVFFITEENAAAQRNIDDYEYGDISTINYFLKGTLPTYQRNLPISEDDPIKDDIPDDALIRYEYGYAFQNVNDYYFYNRVTRRWEGKAPLMDSGVLIGGNAKSQHFTLRNNLYRYKKTQLR